MTEREQVSPESADSHARRVSELLANAAVDDAALVFPTQATDADLELVRRHLSERGIVLRLERALS